VLSVDLVTKPTLYAGGLIKQATHKPLTSLRLCGLPEVHFSTLVPKLAFALQILQAALARVLSEAAIGLAGTKDASARVFAPGSVRGVIVDLCALLSELAGALQVPQTRLGGNRGKLARCTR